MAESQAQLKQMYANLNRYINGRTMGRVTSGGKPTDKKPCNQRRQEYKDGVNTR